MHRETHRHREEHRAGTRKRERERERERRHTGTEEGTEQAQGRRRAGAEAQSRHRGYVFLAQRHRGCTRKAHRGRGKNFTHSLFLRGGSLSLFLRGGFLSLFLRGGFLSLFLRGGSLSLFLRGGSLRKAQLRSRGFSDNVRTCNRDLATPLPSPSPAPTASDNLPVQLLFRSVRDQRGTCTQMRSAMRRGTRHLTSEHKKNLFASMNARKSAQLAAFESSTTSHRYFSRAARRSSTNSGFKMPPIFFAGNFPANCGNLRDSQDPRKGLCMCMWHC